MSALAIQVSNCNSKCNSTATSATALQQHFLKNKTAINARWQQQTGSSQTAVVSASEMETMQ